MNIRRIRVAVGGIMIAAAAAGVMERTRRSDRPQASPIPARAPDIHRSPTGERGIVSTAAPAPASARARVLRSYGRLPLAFEANAGQADPAVKFFTRGAGHTLFLTSTDAVLALRGRPDANGGANHAVLRMQLDGSSGSSRITGEGPLPGRVNHLSGTDTARWRTAVRAYRQVRYEDVYPGIDLAYYGNQHELEFDFIVSPGADPAVVRLRFAGAAGISLDAEGDLLLETDAGLVRQRRPVVYQEDNGSRTIVTAAYVLDAAGGVSFDLGAYDHTRPLIIDPVIAYSVSLGGGGDGAYGVAVDGSGAAYVTGNTWSPGFPVSATAFQPSKSTFDDAFVAKLSPSGDEIVYSTYLGGNDRDNGYRIAVDGSGHAYVVGSTSSSNFPVANAFQSAPGGGEDVFVTKLSADGSQLLYSTLLGGAAGDNGRGIAVDANGHAFVAGNSFSSNFPTVGGTAHAGQQDAFLVKVDTAASGAASVVYATCIGASGWDIGTDVAVDGAGAAYLTGWTMSSNFPLQNPLQSTFGFRDAFVLKMNPQGSGLVYSTLLGGTGNDEAYGIAVGADGAATISGYTDSTDFPLANAAQSTNGGGADVFAARLNPSGTALVYSTYFGGDGREYGYDVAVDASGGTYIAGETESQNLPVVDAVQPTSGSECSEFDPEFDPEENPDEEPPCISYFTEAFVISLASDGVIRYATYLGGPENDRAFGVAVDGNGGVYVSGDADSSSVALITKIAGDNTGTGGGVTVQPSVVLPDGSAVAVSVAFDQVIAPGSTTVTASSTGAPAPSGYTFGNPPVYFDVTTTAQFSGMIQLCFTWQEGAVGNEQNARLLHLNAGVWEDITTSVDSSANVICGQTASLSPFIIAETAPTTIPATITLTQLSQTYDGSARAVIASTSPSGLAVSITYDGSPAAPTDAGSYAVVATLTASGYTADPATGTLVILPAGQTISFDPLPDKQVGDPPIGVSASASSGLPVTFTAAGSCSVSGGIVTLSGAGTCSVTASQAGGGNYGPAIPQTRSFSVKYGWSNVLQPVNPDGSSIFKLGSTVPVKFQLTGASAGVTDLPARLYLTRLASTVIGSEVEAVSTAASDAGNVFRYDAAAGQYVYNLSTRGLSQGAWQLRIDLGDGAANTVVISLKK